MHTNLIYLINFILETETTEENQPRTTTEAYQPFSTTTEEIWKDISSEESVEYIQQEIITKQIIHNKHD
jgi:hypothetical protein